MKVYKIANDKLVLEDKSIKYLKLEVKTKDDSLIKDKEINSLYNGYILAYRLKEMKASKQIICCDNYETLITLSASLIENIFRYTDLNKEDVKELIDMCYKNSKEKR